MPAHVVVDDLRIVFRTVAGDEMAAVRNVGFALAKGQTLGIVGESGSGKSTLARALLGFVRPGARIVAGRVAVGDFDVLGLSPAALRSYRGGRAAMVPQNPLSSLTPHMTVGQQLIELVGLHCGMRGREARDRVLELMAETELPMPAVLFRRYPHELSGGQRQRVVIAAALVASPELIVLDEPTTALDKTVESRVLDLVARVQRSLEATLVYVSHDLNVIARMCRQVLVMRNGAVVETGPVDRIFHRAETEYARRLVGAIPRLVPKRSACTATPAGGNGSVLSVRGVRFGYDRPGGILGRRMPAVLAVDGVSFALAPGRTLGVVGESGSGKSTIAALIAGALAGHQGEILLSGQPVSGPARRRPKEMRRRIQMIFQDPLSSLNPALTVGAILCRPLRLYFGMSQAQAQDAALALLAELDLSPEHMARRPRQLSGGQQQRVAIARALSAQPEVVLCDEITSALDVTVQAQVLALLRRLQQQRGVAYVFISHDLAVVASLADQLLVLEHGRMRDYGPTAEVIAAPSSTYTAQLIAAFVGASPTDAEENEPDIRSVAGREPAAAAG